MAKWEFGELIKKAKRIGRPRMKPERETDVYPRLMQVLAGQPVQKKLPVYKPTPWNLRAFSRNPYARRAINAIKNPIANMPWVIEPIKGVEWNSELMRQAEIVVAVLNKPNAEDDFQSFTEAVLEDTFCGAGAIERQPSSNPDHPVFLWPVDGLSIQIYPQWDGNPSSPKYCQVPGYGTIAGNTAGIDLRADELIYIKPNPTTSTPFGTGEMEIAFMSISRSIGVTEYAGNLASNARPSVILNLGKIDQATLEKFRSYWTNEIEGQGKLPISAGEGATALQLGPEGDNALFLKWQEFCKVEIATAFNLSPQNLGVERDVNRNTAEVAEDRDFEQAIKPYALMYQRKITNEIIHAALGFSQLRFTFEGLDREDEKAAAEIHQIYYKMNVLTPNEIREELGKEPDDSEWANLHDADVQIAIIAARGVSQVIDEDIPGGKAANNSANQNRKTKGV